MAAFGDLIGAYSWFGEDWPDFEKRATLAKEAKETDMADETELSTAQAAHGRVLAELEQTRAEHAAAIKALQDEIDALKEERKATVNEAGERIRALQDEGSRVCLEEKVAHDAELHAQGKTIARMKGELRELNKRMLGHEIDEPPLEDDIPVEPVPGEIEPEETG